LTLPASLVENVGSGDGLITIEQVSPKTSSGNLRSHDAFLNSYAPEDEGLYNAKCD
jgi:hypothetical protein